MSFRNVSIILWDESVGLRDVSIDLRDKVSFSLRIESPSRRIESAALLRRYISGDSPTVSVLCFIVSACADAVVPNTTDAAVNNTVARNK